MVGYQDITQEVESTGYFQDIFIPVKGYRRDRFPVRLYDGSLSLSVAESPTTPPTPTGHQGDVFVIIINVCDSLSRVVGVLISTPFPPSSFPNPLKKKKV